MLYGKAFVGVQSGTHLDTDRFVNMVVDVRSLIALVLFMVTTVLANFF